MEKDGVKILTLSDSALCVELGQGIELKTNRRVHSLCRAVKAANIAGVTELVPTYRSLAVHYDIRRTDEDSLKDALRPIIDALGEGETAQGELIKIPVLYGGEFGPDIETVAKLNSLSVDDVIAIHSAPEYPVYMLGFLPGFCYLGGMDKRIAAPRLKTPKVRIEPGSVGIAGEQTGIYPLASPGGWQLIGRTPLSLYSPKREKPIFIEAGMRIKFYPVTLAEFERIKAGEESK
jgi:inhibitor of KinA